jgi:hypothetical protein
MTTKKVQKGSAKGKGARLSGAATVERIFKLQRDEPFDSGDYLCVGDLVNDLLSYAGADTTDREIFTHAFTLAARRVERKSGRVSPAAEKAYRDLRDLLERLDAGEPLEEIERSERRRYERKQSRQRAAMMKRPEPKDKTSDEWRYWKIRNLEAALQDGDVEAWGEFWSYLDAFKDAGLSADTYTATAYTAARSMLADLLIFWQKQQPKGKARGGRK